MKITAIVGTYNKGGIIDSAVDEILSTAREQGADIDKIYLLDHQIEFCRNCQNCAQGEGISRGHCPIKDDMPGILDRVDASDGLVLASPMNFGTVTALMKCFIERLICYAYWPWSHMGPTHRIQTGTKRAIVVASCAAPGLQGWYFTGIVKLLKDAARLLGAAGADTLFIGLARHTPESTLSKRHVRRARKLALRLIR